MPPEKKTKTKNILESFELLSVLVVFFGALEKDSCKNLLNYCMFFSIVGLG